jgi:hypothetical protein
VPRTVFEIEGREIKPQWAVFKLSKGSFFFIFVVSGSFVPFGYMADTSLKDS